MTQSVSPKIQTKLKTLTGAVCAVLLLSACSDTEAKPPIVKPGGIGQAPVCLLYTSPSPRDS